MIGQYEHREVRGAYFAFAVCGVCYFPTTFQYVDNHIHYSGMDNVDLVKYDVEFPGSRFAIRNFWPEDAKDTPSDLPENVARFFEQGVQNEKSQNWDAAGAMFRKALDVTTKILNPENSGKNLFQRINKLSENGRLTKDPAIWAHEVRIDGNESVHGDDPETADDVAAIHEFCRAILLYCFSLPALVAARSSQPSTD